MRNLLMLLHLQSSIWKRNSLCPFYRSLDSKLLFCRDRLIRFSNLIKNTRSLMKWEKVSMVQFTKSNQKVTTCTTLQKNFIINRQILCKRRLYQDNLWLIKLGTEKFSNKILRWVWENWEPVLLSILLGRNYY